MLWCQPTPESSSHLKHGLPVVEDPTWPLAGPCGWVLGNASDILDMWEMIHRAVPFSTEIFALSSILYKYLRLLLVSATLMLRIKHNSQGITQERRGERFWSFLILYVQLSFPFAGIFSVCSSREPLVAGFGSNAMNIPYVSCQTCHTEVWSPSTKGETSRVYSHCLWV